MLNKKTKQKTTTKKTKQNRKEKNKKGFFVFCFCGYFLWLFFVVVFCGCFLWLFFVFGLCCMENGGLIRTTDWTAGLCFYPFLYSLFIKDVVAT